MMAEWFSLVSDRSAELWLRTGEHLMLTGVSTLVAVLVGIPTGILAAKVGSLRGALTGFIGILQTIPSLAMLAILLALLQQIGVVPAIIALTLYALLPIVRNTLTGIEGVPASVAEAARGVGMTSRQQLLLIELPLAMPTIVAGIRTAAVVGVGIATLSAFIGAGGLGEFINRGLALSKTNLIMLGAVPAALLALIVDGCIAAFQWGMAYGQAGSRRQPAVRGAALALPFVLLALGLFGPGSGDRLQRSFGGEGDEGTGVRVGSKNFTEQLILGEMIAQMLEEHTDLTVRRRFNLGGTMICHEALVSGAIDIYPEYIGTAMTAILDGPVTSDSDSAFTHVSDAYGERYACEWLEPFGFENTYALAIRESFAKERGVSTLTELSPLTPSLRAGFTSEFIERGDGYAGLKRVYGHSFSDIHDMDPSLMYEAVASDEVDVISAFSTDGRIKAFNLRVLEDDRRFFPPYLASAVVRSDLLAAHPEVKDVLARLADRIDTETMQSLNDRVDRLKERPRRVARKFLRERGLLNGEAPGSKTR
jgi:osmoprotectant transport system permease protein